MCTNYHPDCLESSVVFLVSRASVSFILCGCAVHRCGVSSAFAAVWLLQLHGGTLTNRAERMSRVSD